MNAFDVTAVAGTSSSWKKVPSGMGELFATAFASSSTYEFSALGMYLSVNPWNLCSKALTVAKYLTNLGSHAMYSFSTYPATT